jgi:hypothetical protein
MSLRIYRRHAGKCKYSDRSENRCRCKIWYDWHIDGQRYNRPLKTRDWQKALQLGAKN